MASIPEQMLNSLWLAGVRGWRVEAAFIDHGAIWRKDRPAERPAFAEMTSLLPSLELDALLVATHHVLQWKKDVGVVRELHLHHGLETLSADEPIRCEVARDCPETVTMRALSPQLGCWILSCDDHTAALDSLGMEAEPLPNVAALTEKVYTGAFRSNAHQDWKGHFEQKWGVPDDSEPRGSLADWGLALPN